MPLSTVLIMTENGFDTIPAIEPAQSEPAPTTWLERMPHPRVVSLAGAGLVLFTVLFAFLAARRSPTAGALEAVALCGALAIILAFPARLGSRLSIVAAATFFAIEAAARGLGKAVDGVDIALAFSLTAALLSASSLRLGIRRRDVELAVAADTINELTRHDRISEKLAGGREPTWLEAELARARRHHHQLSLVLLEPDRFVELRERVGADLAQELLVAVAEIVGAELRATDLPLRHGSHGFSLVLPETAPEGARVLAERIRLLVPERIGLPDWPAVTVSAGIASFPADATTNEDLVLIAERALERAMEVGGNRTILASLARGGPRGWTLAGGVTTDPAC
jgi:diguanylate cyclase (GGDEF)-like protein